MNRYGGVTLIIADASIEAVRLSGTIRTDRADQLVRILEADFGVQVDWNGDTEARLRGLAGKK